MTRADEPEDTAGSEAQATPGGTPSAERWRDIQRVVDGALDLPLDARTAYLDEACGPDTALRDQAVRLLEACERGGRLDAILAGSATGFGASLLTDLAARAGERGAALAGALRAALPPHYAVDRELGRGGMATVFLARDLRHDRTVAIKVLDRNVASAGAERFLHEIRIAARLTHPHVLGVHDSGEAKGILYYVMPYVEGETLRERLAREGALPLADAVRFVRELADALTYAHGRGVVHRDLKPENVLLSGGHAVVADFGIAKAIAAATGADRPAHGSAMDVSSGTALTSAGVALGTPAYMAPEQATGDPATDHRADLYALGVIAYEVLAGTHPFGARTPQALVAAHLTETPGPLDERRPDAPPALAALVMRLLEKNPAARPQTADEVLRVLNGIPAAPTGAAAATVAEIGKRRFRVALMLTLLLVAGAAAYVVWRDGREADANHGRTSAGPAVIRTLAVLPFENIGADATDEYFSDGMTDELAHALARIPGIRLAGRTSSYTFKGRAAPAEEIGRVLGVDAFVNGTVRRAGDRLRLTAQLVSATDGTVLRDSVFESRTGDVFAVQDELTRGIVAVLAPALGDRGASAATADLSRGTTDQEAYDLYLKGRYHFLARGADNVRLAIAYFRQAIARDPRFARGHAGLALAYGVLPVYVPDPTDSARALTSASAERAMALDSMLADANIAMGLALEQRLRLADAETRYRAALALEPSNATAHHLLGFFLHLTGRTEEAVLELRQASELDPLAKSAAASLAAALAAARRFPEAVAASRRALALDSTFPLAMHTLGFAQAFGGQPESAVRTLERGLQLHPEGLGLRPLLVFAYAANGRWADAERLRMQLRRGGDATGGVEAALADLVLGDPEPAIRMSATAAGQGRWYNVVGFGCNPFLDPLWSDGRFRAAARALGVAACPLARPWPVPPRPPARRSVRS